MSPSVLTTDKPNVRSSSNFSSWVLGAGGVLLLALLAQIAIPLPWTPVPITGQTLGVALMPFLFGRRAWAVVGTYLLVAAAGAPVLAGAQSGLGWGPTLGYLVGMWLSATILGFVVATGRIRGFWRSWALTLAGSAIVFALGLGVLSFFVPADALLMAGLWPFLPGDLIKTSLAAASGAALLRARGSSQDTPHLEG